MNVSSVSVESNSLEIARQAESLSTASNRQAIAVHQLSTSFNEVVATAGEVARNCSLAAESAQAGGSEVEAGKQVIKQMMRFVSEVEEFINRSSGSIKELEHDVNSIDIILSNIRGIAEQTNLLALNAAIEAARAGEQGRGFAVVADEVRALAKRTTDSTEQVNALLNGLVESTKKVSITMQQSLECSRELAGCASSVSHAFMNIDAAVVVIRDMSIQISAAAEEQHQVADDINGHIMAISIDAGEITKGAESTQAVTVGLKSASTELGNIVRRFKIE
ncbi:methyl-accepting chemotaxis protein [Pseudomonas sp. NPDC090592]|uniref:methyl-accepting chemotaxis protein n=1 Tax=Pseudomonas sp. NPDC090592 TaxID=3364480 RepID=UPI00383B9F05